MRQAVAPVIASRHWLCARNSHAWRPHYVYRHFDGSCWGLVAAVIAMAPGAWHADHDRCKRCGRRREHVEARRGGD